MNFTIIDLDYDKHLNSLSNENTLNFESDGSIVQTADDYQVVLKNVIGELFSISCLGFVFVLRDS